MWDLRAFVKSILRKPSKPLGASGKAVLLRKMLALLKEEASKASSSDSTKQRATLAELILPEVMQSDRPDNKLAREWAFSLGQMVGFLAGLTVDDSHMDGAINKVMVEAKRNAKMTAENLKQVGLKTSKTPAVSTSAKAGVTLPAEPTKSPTDQRKAMVHDLETQAMLETDPAAKAALSAMAERMKKELDLEKAA